MDTTRADAPDGAVGADEVERLRRALNEEQQRSLRLGADFDSLRRRTGREHDLARGEARRSALLSLLAALREAGAERIESVGRPFDPAVHEAISTVPDDDVEAPVVAREIRSGWRLPDGLLRPAQVVVATPGKPTPPWR